MWTLAIWALLVAALVPLIQRDLRSAQERRRRARFTASLKRVATQIETRMMPAMRQVGVAASQAAAGVEGLAAAMRGYGDGPALGPDAARWRPAPAQESPDQ